MAHKATHNKSRVMREAHRRAKYDPSCGGSLKEGMKKAWSNSKPSRDITTEPEAENEDPLDFSFSNI